MKYNVLNNIRKNNLISALICGLFGAIPTVGFFYYFVNEGLEAWFMLLIFGFMGVLLDWLCIKSIILVIDPRKSDIFKKYGSVENLEKIMKEIEETTIYEDNQLIIAENYVADKKDYERIIALNDILRVHKLVHKTNFVIDSYSVVITDKYNFEISYTYPVKDLEKVDKLIVLIGSMSKNDKLGYSKDSQEYVRKNKVELPNTKEILTSNIKKEAMQKYACPDCGFSIEFGDKFCKNCGCKMDWS